MTVNKLTTFLLGTVDCHSALRILRGKDDILRIIWIYVCSEWWQMHIQPYTIPDLPNLSEEDYNIASIDTDNIPDLRKHSLFERKKYFDCPLAIVDTNIVFPPSSAFSESEVPLSVNMMPFDLFDPEISLPVSLHGYLPLIEKCRSYLKPFVDMKYNTNQRTHKLEYGEKERVRFDHNDPKNRIAYLTVDERPVSGLGQPHRRGGVHVECPGAMRRKEIGDKSKYTPDLSWYHPWGSGWAVDEYLVGGIFLASTVSQSTAVWNCRIHDTFGDMIGPHGSLERMRDLLGPAAKTLEAGELIWLSDRTPHESLPIDNPAVKRQFFRLVVGEIGFWFADHNTANPTGFAVPSEVPIIAGNKFELAKKIIPVVWEYGNTEEIQAARQECEFRERLYRQGVGFMADDLLKLGVYNTQTLVEKEEMVIAFVKALDPRYYSNMVIRFISSKLARVMDEFE